VKPRQKNNGKCKKSFASAKGQEQDSGQWDENSKFSSGRVSERKGRNGRALISQATKTKRSLNFSERRAQGDSKHQTHKKREVDTWENTNEQHSREKGFTAKTKPS